MPTSFDAAPADILNVADGHMQAAQAKWSRLTEGDLSGIRTKGELAARVAARYGLSADQAAADVAVWAADKRFAQWSV